MFQHLGINCTVTLLSLIIPLRGNTMKNTAIALVFGFALTLAASANAAAPAPGTYDSVDLGGLVQTGRGSQSWALPNNAAGGVGDVFNSQSWDGSTLGTQWHMECGLSTSPQTVQDNRNGAGTGTVVFTTQFSGGTFFLSKNGPWGDTVNDLNGVLSNLTSTVTVQYVTFVPVSARGDINTSGYFIGSNCSLTFAITNSVGKGDTDGGPFPANYPALLDPACSATRTNGSWGDIKDVTMLIECVVPTEVSTWSNVKALYR